MGDYERIEAYMFENESYLRSLINVTFTFCAFVFTDGKSINIGSHDNAAEAVGKELNLDIKKSTDLEKYGITRTGYSTGIFFINSHDIPSKLAEDTIKDQIAKNSPSEIMVNFDVMHEKPTEFEAFKKRLNKEFGIPVI